MTGRPILQTQFEKRLWKSINGGGPLGGLNAKRNTPQSILESVLSHEGTVSAGVLVALMDLLDSQGLATTEDLRHIVSKNRPTDCTPSVRASGILLERGEMEAARELLALSSRSQEVLSRSVAEARICMKAGDRAGAEAAALRAYGSDPSCAEAYSILAEVDPAGGWPQMHNIQQVLDGAQPTNPPGEGRVQDLYRIYYEWFRGSREAASDMLANSPHYKDGDRDYMLASARMSVDERDWHSARMMYTRLLPGAPPFLTREVAEACMDAGRPARAVELLAGCDQTSPKTLMDMFLARRMSGDAVETGIALRAYLDSEWVGSAEYLDMVRMLIGFGMDAQAAEVLGVYVDSCGPDSESMLLRSLLYERAGDCMSALVYAYDAARRDRESKAARARVAQVYFAMGDQVRAEKECSRILSESPDDPEALRLMVRIQSRKEDNVSVVSTCKRILESDPGDLDALLELARAQALTGDASGASDSAHRAVRADGSLDTYVRALSALLSAGPGRDVSYLCREAEVRFPESTEVKRIRGNLEYGEGEYLRASATFASALGDAPDDPEWGKTSFRPQLSSVARRASLFDLPDPSEGEADPFDTGAGAPVTQAASDQLSDDPLAPATQPDGPETISTISASDLEEAQPKKFGLFDKLRGFVHRAPANDDESDDEGYEDDENGSWRGGAATRSGLRLVEGEGEADAESEEAPSEEDLRDAVLQLGDDALIAHDIWFVALGGSSLDHAGMRSFLARHRSEVRGCFVVNLDCIGAGALTALKNEGLELTRRGDRRIYRLLSGVAADLHTELALEPHDWADTDATPAMRRSLRGLTLMGLDANGLPALSKTADDVAENVSGDQAATVASMVTEMIRRS